MAEYDVQIIFVQRAEERGYKMNELQSLSQIFQNKIFRIPDYQRGYAWQDPQLRDFWEDIINLQEDRYHYTGLLSLKVLSRSESQKLGKDVIIKAITNHTGLLWCTVSFI